MLKLAINGFGRIGKTVLREFLKRDMQNIEIVAVNSNELSPDLASYLLKYDSVHGRLDAEVNHDEGHIYANGKKIKISSEKSIESLDWEGIDIVLECTGIHNSARSAIKHVKRGAKKVIISAPSKDADFTVVLGVNEKEMIKQIDSLKSISVSSCTTNCFAPSILPIHDAFHIKSGFLTTVHSYTNDQSLVDSRHSKELRRGRSAALSMIPTSTGAAKSIGLVIPSLQGKVDGASIRVPTPNVSMIDFSFSTQNEVTLEKLHDCILRYSEKNKNILAVNYEELVSADFCGSKESAIFDMTQTKIMGKNFARIVSWYDNETGFANRMIDLCSIIEESSSLKMAG